MTGTLLRDSTGRTQLQEPAEYYQYSAASDPRTIDWTVQRIVRWFPFHDPGRAENLPWTFVSNVTSTGFYDVVTLSLRPDALSEASFPLYYPTVGDWMAQDFFRRSVEGPSPLGGPLENATVQEIEDPAFGKEFIEYFQPSLAQIGRLAELNEGWDSYGANRIDSEARGAAVRFLSLLRGKGRDVPHPIVGPSPSGAVALQWFLPQFEIFTEISGDVAEFYVARPEEDQVLLEGTVDKLEELTSTILPFLV